MRHKKEIFRIGLMLLAVMLFCVAPAAAVDRTLSVGTVSGSGGNEVLLPITVSDATGIGGIAFTLNYNPQVLTFNGLASGLKEVSNGDAYLPPPDAGYNATQIANIKASFFYQYNDEGAPSAPIGRVMVAAATPVGLTGTNPVVLFNAKFSIKPQAPGGAYPIGIARSIIYNPAAGYNQSQVIPALVNASTPKTDGTYDQTDFKTIGAILAGGSVSVAQWGYKISGKVYYGVGTTPAGGSVVILKKAAAAGGFVYDSQATVSTTDGSYSFSNKPTGSYQLTVQSSDPGYLGSGEISVTVASVDKTVDAIHLAAVAATYERYTGTISAYYPGMQIKVYATTDLVNPIGVFPVAADKSWTTGLLLNSGTYKFYVTYGNLLKQEVTKDDLTTLDGTWSLKKISGTISSLPADAVVTIMAGSTSAGVQKMVRKTVGTGSYEITDLVPAADYIVSMAGAGKPLTYYNMTTDFTAATPVDISAGDNTVVHFPFPSVTTGTISGKVYETAVTNPVAGIAVYAFETETYALTQALTGADGGYIFKLIPGKYQIFLIKADGKIFYYNTAAATQNDAEATVIPVTAGGSENDKDMNIAECTNILSGKVTFERSDGMPAVNILITAFSTTNSSRAAAITGQNGVYALTGLCGAAKYNVVMQPLAGPYAGQRKELSVPAVPSEDPNFVIDSGNVLSGTVKNELSANVDNAIIYLLNQETGTLANNRVYFSASGKYEVGDVANGVYTLKGSHTDYQTYTKSDLGIYKDEPGENILFTKGGRFTGTVTAASGGAALAGVSVIVTRADSLPVSVVTNNLGKYDVYGLVVDNTKPYTIIVQKQGYVRQILANKVPATGDGTVVNVALATPAATFDLIGTVTKTGGAVVPNVVVLLTAKGGEFFASTLTNDSGVYNFTKLPQADDYRLVVLLGSNPAYSESINWLTATGLVTKPVPIAWGDTTKISGTVTLSPIGSSVISVFLYRAADNSSVAFAQAVGGAYEFQGLASGSYKVLAVSPGYGPRWYGASATNITNAGEVLTGTTVPTITLTAE